MNSGVTVRMIKALGLTQQVPVHEGTLTILKGINLEIKSGESVAIVGASGSGKSTLLGMLAGLDTPSTGQIWLQGQEITKLDEEARARVRAQLVAFIFQNFQLLGSLTALENVMLPLEVRGLADSEERARDYLHKVGLAQRDYHYPHLLSGGEQQRVAIARAFACEAPILFADEPTGNLDTATGESISDLLFSLHSALDPDARRTLVLVTHDQALARRCDRQLVMQAGQLSGTRR
jgi:putative ABC transport system ATP-binding protein